MSRLMLTLVLFNLNFINLARSATTSHVIMGPALPAKCSPLTGDVWFLTTTGPATGVMYTCTALNTWTTLGASSVAAIPALTPPTFSTANIVNIPNTVYDYVMQEKTGNSFNDSSVNVNKVNCGGTVTWDSNGPGKLAAGTAAHFPGTFDCPASSFSTFNPTSATAFSVSIWASFDSLNVTDIIISQISSATNHPGWQLMKLDNSGDPNNLALQMFDSSAGILNVEFAGSAQGLTAGRLYNFAFTYDGSHVCNGIHGYIDGDQFPIFCKTNTMAGAMTPGVPVYLGSRAFNTIGRHIGYLAGARVLTGVMTYPQIVNTFMAGPFSDSYTTATVTSSTVYASSFATLDCNLSTGAKIGGGTATNNDVKLNAVLMTASATSPIDLILNGSTCSNGLFIPQTGSVTIEGIGWNSGIFMNAKANHSAITNGYGANPHGVIPSQGSNVIIRNMKINANRGTFPNGNSTSTDARGAPWIMTIELSSLNNVLVDNVWIYDSCAYNFLGSNISQSRWNNMRIEVPIVGSEVNTDGIHIDGPADHLTITNSWFATGDDSIALNSPEGYAGNITDVQILNTQEAGSAQSLRVYTCATGATTCYIADRILVSGITGSTLNNFFNLGAGVINANKLVDAIRSIRFSGLSVTSSLGASFMFLVSDPIGEMIIDNSTWISPIGSPILAQTVNSGGTTSSMQWNNFKIYRNAIGNASPTLLSLGNNWAINTLTINGFSVEDTAGTSYAAIANVVDVPSGGSIGVLKVNNWDPTHFSTFLSAGSNARITNIYGLESGDCVSSASPSVCGSNSLGAATLAAAATSQVVNTTEVHTNSVIMITEDQSLGTKLGVTCNTQGLLVVGTPRVTARTAGTSFTVGVDVAPTTNPICFNWRIYN